MPGPKPQSITALGETLSITAWAARFGVGVSTIRSRLQLGWCPDDAVRVKADRRFRGGGRLSEQAPRPCPRLKERYDGLAYCRWSVAGKDHFRYFGRYGTKEAAAAYNRFAAAWVAGQAEPDRPPPEPDTLLVAGLCDAFLAHAEAYYVKGGKVTSEYHCLRSAVGALVEESGPRLARAYTTDDFAALLKRMEGKGWTRGTCNKNAERVTRIFGWAAMKGLVPVEVHARLRLAPRLRRGATSAPDRPKVKSVLRDHVAAIFPHLYPGHEARRTVLEALVRFHWLTGMRPQAVVSMTPADLHREPDIWEYRAPDRANKNAHRDQGYSIWIGPRAQAVAAPLLADCPDDRAVFALPPRAKAGVRWWRLSTGAYRKLVAKACRAAGVPVWNPHQLKHSRATEVKRIYESDEAAATAIGTSPEVTANVYVDPTEAAAKRIARETG
jgi:integrase